MILSNRCVLAFLAIAALTAPAAGQPEPAPPAPTVAQPLSAPAVTPPPPNLAANARAEAASVDEGDKLRTPDSPAFTILGVAPTAIAKPTTPRALAVSLSKFINEGAMLEVPSGLAVEVAPFWLWGLDRFELADYGDNDLGQLHRNLSLSLGTSSADTSGASRMASGIRTHVAFDRAPTPACWGYEKAAQTALILSPAEMRSLRDEHTVDGTLDHASFDEALRERKAQKVKDAKLVLGSCAAAAAARPRVLALAAALAWRFPSSAAKNGDFVSQAYWATYSHRVGDWSLLGLGRLRFDEADRGWDGFFDVGARAIFTRSTYAAAFEAIGRKQAFGDDASDADLQLRLALQVEYLVDGGTWLSVSFGKDFAAADAGSLFSLANLTTSFGDPEIEP